MGPVGLRQIVRLSNGASEQCRLKGETDYGHQNPDAIDIIPTDRQLLDAAKSTIPTPYDSRTKHGRTTP